MRTAILAMSAALAAPSAWADAADVSTPKFTLNSAEAPDAKPWAEPAQISYTKDKGSAAAFSVDAAGRLDWRVGDPRTTTDTAFIRGVVHRDTASGSQVESYAAELGMHFEPHFPRDLSDANVADKAWYFFNDLSLGYNYTTNFGDEASGCDSDPKPATCVRSHEGSIRLKWTVQPWNDVFDTSEAYIHGKPTESSPIIAYSFGPLVSFFADDVTNAKADASGVTPKGFATGAVGALNLALTPQVLGYRLVLRTSVQQTEVITRSKTRQSEMPHSSTLGSVSLDYELGKRSFESGPGWTPSIGVSYKRGDDPLSGKLDQEETVLGVKLTYKTK